MIENWIESGALGVYFYLLGGIAFYFNLIKDSKISLTKGILVYAIVSILIIKIIFR